MRGKKPEPAIARLAAGAYPEIVDWIAWLQCGLRCGWYCASGDKEGSESEEGGDEMHCELVVGSWARLVVLELDLCC
jgi:hypothetical protein